MTGMEPITDVRMRELEAFLSFVATAESDRAIKARSFHALRLFSEDDFRRTASILREAEATAGFAFLGRDIEEHRTSLEYLHGEGHEIVLHGDRHVRFDSISQATAHQDLSRGINAIEDATGITPAGFFAPFSRVNEDTLQAVKELGLDWVMGRTDARIPAGVSLVESVYPHDTRLLEGGMSPNNTFEELHQAAAPDRTFLFHPNMLEYYQAIDEFDDWVQEVTPVTIRDHLDGEGPGIVLDCLQPIKPI